MTPIRPFYFDPRIGEFLPLPEKELEIVFFKSNVNILIDEQPAIISWEVHNATKVRINNKSVSLSGSMNFHSFESQTIKLVAKNKKKRSVERSLYIGVNKTPPKIVYFKTNKSSVIENSIVTLSWYVVGALKIIIDNGIGDVTGKSELEIIVYRDVEYKLTAKNYFGVETHAYLSFSIFPSQLIQSLVIPVPEFNIRSVSLDQLTFDLQTVINTNLKINQPEFTNLIETTELNMPVPRILLNESMVTSVLFPNNVFKWLIKRQKEINHTINSLWKTSVKRRLKD